MTALEDAPGLFEAPVEEERAGYRLRSLAHLSWAMGRLAAIQRRRLDVKTTAQAEVDRVRRWEAEEDAREARDAAWFEAIIQAYALDHRDDHRKTFTTPHGVVKTRTVQAPWDIDDGALIPWLRQHRPDLVKTTEAVRVGDVKRELGRGVEAGLVYDPTTGEPVPGVKVGEPSLTASVEVDLRLHAEDE